MTSEDNTFDNTFDDFLAMLGGMRFGEIIAALKSDDNDTPTKLLTVSCIVGLMGICLETVNPTITTLAESSILARLSTDLLLGAARATEAAEKQKIAHKKTHRQVIHLKPYTKLYDHERDDNGPAA